jgi:hypothetical protein
MLSAVKILCDTFTMPLSLINQVPINPGPVEKYHSVRESDHMESTKEIFAKLAALVQFIDQFCPPQYITDVNGNVWLALAALTGNEPIGTPLDFQLTDMSTESTLKIGIFGGSVLDNNSSTLFTPTGLTLGQYTAFTVSSGDTVAYLEINYAETIAGGVTSMSVDTAATLPSSSSGTYYLPLGTFTVGDSSVTVTSSPIGDQVFASGRQWYSNPSSYTAIAGGV